MAMTPVDLHVQYGGVAQTSLASPKEALAGLVDRVTLHNPENGFCVLRVKARGQRDLITVIGHAAMISAGKFKRVTVAEERPHGLSYSFTLHASDGPRLVRFDNAYVAPARGLPVQTAAGD